MISAAGVIDHEAQYGDDDYLCYADHRSDNLNTGTYNAAILLVH